MLKALLISLVLVVGSTVKAEQHILTFGVVPQQSASKLAQLWGPVLKKLSEETGMLIRFSTAPDIPSFEERLANGEYDIAYMNPYHYTVFSESPGYRALAHARDKQIKGIVVVRKDSQITRLEELSSATIAFPAPAAFAATLLPRGYMAQNGISHIAAFVSSHDSVYRAVAKGLYPAGGGIVRTFSNVDPEIQDQLRVLWTSDGYTPHAIAVHPDVTAEQAALLQQAIVSFDTDEHGKTLLQALKINGFQAADDADWDDVRSLKLEELQPAGRTDETKDAS